MLGLCIRHSVYILRTYWASIRSSNLQLVYPVRVLDQGALGDAYCLRKDELEPMEISRTCGGTSHGPIKMNP